MRPSGPYTSSVDVFQDRSGLMQMFECFAQSKSPPPTLMSTSTSADTTTVHSITDMDNTWSPWLGLPLSPLQNHHSLPAYMPHTPTPRPPVPSEALSPFSSYSPMSFRYPSISPTPPEVREES